MSPRAYRAGESLEDYCRACKMDRMHTAIAVDQAGAPLRVECGYCRSQHNYRGGARVDASPPAAAGGLPPARPEATPARHDGALRASGAADRHLAVGPLSDPAGGRGVPPDPSQDRLTSAPAFSRARTGTTEDLVSERERTARTMAANPETDALELLLRRVIREEAGLTPVAPAQKWRGGTLVLRPAAVGLQEKSWPIETFFNKVVMLRNRLRSLEQHVNASDLPDDVKIKLQGYVSGCYGSLTSFNLLFADEEDKFKSGGGE